MHLLFVLFALAFLVNPVTANDTCEWNGQTYQAGESYGDALPTRCIGDTADYPCFCNPNLSPPIECPYCTHVSEGGDLVCLKDGDQDVSFIDSSGVGKTCSCSIPIPFDGQTVVSSCTDAPTCTLSIDGSTQIFAQGQAIPLPNRCVGPDNYECVCNPDAPGQIECMFCTNVAENGDLMCALQGQTIDLINTSGDSVSCACENSGGSYTSTCSPRLPAPSTNAPTVAPPSGGGGIFPPSFVFPEPTPRPTPVPTPMPTPSPVAPTLSPVTPGPTPNPTPAPVQQGPTPVLTPRPTPNPTPAPVAGSTPLPTPAPTTAAPVSSPTLPPVLAPAPTPVPTPVPTTASPVATPNAPPVFAPAPTPVPTPVPTEPNALPPFLIPLPTPRPSTQAPSPPVSVPSPTLSPTGLRPTVPSAVTTQPTTTNGTLDQEILANDDTSPKFYEKPEMIWILIGLAGLAVMTSCVSVGLLCERRCQSRSAMARRKRRDDTSSSSDGDSSSSSDSSGSRNSVSRSTFQVDQAIP